MSPGDAPLTPEQKAEAALLQAAAHGERLAELTERLEALADTPERLEAIEERLAEIEDAPGGGKVYHPRPAPRWWLLAGEKREEALAPLRAWVEQIYQPVYGPLARLPACWEQHDACLITLDWLAELWQVLYLRPRRTAGILASQAEWQTRLLPAAADQLVAAAAGCEHRQVLP